MSAKQRRARLMPELDLPPKLLDLVRAYLGPRRMNNLSPEQRSNIVRLCNDYAGAVGKTINEGRKDA